MRTILVCFFLLSVSLTGCQSKKNLEDKIERSLSQVDKEKIAQYDAALQNSLFPFPEDFEQLIERQEEHAELPSSMSDLLHTNHERSESLPQNIPQD